MAKFVTMGKDDLSLPFCESSGRKWYTQGLLFFSSLKRELSSEGDNEGESKIENEKWLRKCDEHNLQMLNGEKDSACPAILPPPIVAAWIRDTLKY